MLKNASRWHALGTLRFGEGYNAALQQITDAFVTTYGPASLNQLRTNEIALAEPVMLSGQPGPDVTDQVWELREFKLVNGLLQVAPVQATPGDELNGDPEFAQYLLDHRDDLLAGNLALGSYAGQPDREIVAT